MTGNLQVIGSTAPRAHDLTILVKVLAILVAGIAVAWGMIFPPGAVAADEKWKAEMIADALLAAPPSVTRNARIFAWNAEGDLILVRPGTGPYTCLASGFSSLRLGKPRRERFIPGGIMLQRGAVVDHRNPGTIVGSFRRNVCR